MKLFIAPALHISPTSLAFPNYKAENAVFHKNIYTNVVKNVNSVLLTTENLLKQPFPTENVFVFRYITFLEGWKCLLVWKRLVHLWGNAREVKGEGRMHPACRKKGKFKENSPLICVHWLCDVHVWLGTNARRLVTFDAHRVKYFRADLKYNFNFSSVWKMYEVYCMTVWTRMTRNYEQL